MTFNTIHWLPPHLAEMTVWQEICRAYDYLLSRAFEALDEVYANQFLDSLTEIGCLIWENLLGITAVPGASLEERRRTIKSYLNSDLPYTENKLREVLESLAGDDAVSLKVTQSEYEIKIDLLVSTPSVIAGAKEIVYKMRPANMIVRILIHYDRTVPLYVGHAIRHTKVLYPTDFSVVDPTANLTYFVDGDGALLIDIDKSIFIEEA